MIPGAAYPIHEPPLTREQLIEAAEDRAEQAAYDAMREGPTTAGLLAGLAATREADQEARFARLLPRDVAREAGA